MRRELDGVWRDVGAVIFDVDGTLYDRARLRRRMLAELAGYYLRRPTRVAELRVLQRFRAMRERLAIEEVDVRTAQFERAAARAGVATRHVEALVERWIERAPLPHLRACRYPGVDELFAGLTRKGVKIGVLSDYPAAQKLAALELAAAVVRSATDPDVGRLKPHPAGLFRVAELLEEPPGRCLVVGDREDRDAAAARRAGMRFLILERRPTRRAGGFTSFSALLAALEGSPAPRSARRRFAADGLRAGSRRTR